MGKRRMTASTWRVVGASVIGTSHSRSGAPCQDTHIYRQIETKIGCVLLIAVSDGAGSAARSEEGSRLACSSFVTAAEQHLGTSDVFPGRSFYLDWLVAFQEEVRSLARDAGVEPRDYACTFIGAVVAENWASIGQIGDGSVVAAGDEVDDFAWVTWPQNGEYANVTNFATDPRAADVLYIELLQQPVREVAVFTDGVQTLALHMQSKTAHQPFFTGMFAPMRSAQFDEQTLTGGLASFLGSERVNERTDDDKTLVLASRVAVNTPVNAEAADAAV